MAADLKLLKRGPAIDETPVEDLADAYRRALRGKVCRTHGRGIRVSEPDEGGDISISGCCEEFVREASRALN